MNRTHNFNPGPAALPLEVLQTIQGEMLDYRGTGMSVLEISHRSKEFEATLNETKDTVRKLLGVPESHDILFAGGGASLQFSMVPMNFLGEGESADYVVTGEWSKKAVKEAKLFGNVNAAASSEAKGFAFIPTEFHFSPQAKYVHITSNNTIFGTQWKSFPDTGNVPLFADMSSDLLSQRVDVSRFALIYAGAQKNMGPAGVTAIIMRKDLLSRAVQNRKIPTMMNYKTYLENNSLYNTPPVFAIYVTGLFAKWVEKMGGIEAMEKINARKAELLYGTIDAFPAFYKGTVEPASRSWMNATFRMPSEELETKFVKQAAASGFIGLKGHRSVGGIRVSMYNAISVDTIEKLTAFMRNFAQSHA